MADLLDEALRSHQAGHLDEAEVLYRQVLTESPEDADALHLLGVLALQRGRADEAIPMIREAVARMPATALFHTNLSEALRTVGDYAEAETHARQALELNPASAEALHNLGQALAGQGKFAEAEKVLEQAIERNPLLPAVYISLANMLRDQDRPNEALAFLREGLRLIPGAPGLRSHLGLHLAQIGQPGDGLEHCADAVRQQPSVAQGHYHLGIVLLGLGRLQEAASSFQRAVALQPRLGMAYNGLGQLAQAEGRTTLALIWFRKSVQLEPRSAALRRDLAIALRDNGQVDDAIGEFREALRLQPFDATLHNNLGYLLQDRGELDAAVASYREAIRLRPDHPDAFVNLGLTLAEQGELADAETAFRTALHLDPGHPEGLAALALARREHLAADEVASAQQTLADRNVPPLRLAVLQYGMAQYHDARGEFARVVELVEQANRCLQNEDQRRGVAYQPAEHQDYVDQIIAAYTPAHFERVRGWGVAADEPVFIVGMPRSGTSLVEQILASHPQVHGGGELEFARDCYRAIPALVSKEAPGIACVPDLTPEIVRQLAEQYLSRLRHLAPQATRIVDKMPDNYLMLGLIATMLPQARIIHVRRDWRDVALSCWMTFFRHIRWSLSPEGIRGRLTNYQRLMDHWRRVLPMTLLEVDYEELVADTETSARKVVAWAGLEWDPACLDFHRTRRVVRTASMLQVRQPVYNRSVGRWKHYLPFLPSLLADLPSGSAPEAT